MLRGARRLLGSSLAAACRSSRSGRAVGAGLTAAAAGLSIAACDSGERCSQVAGWRGHLEARREVIATAQRMNDEGINQGTSGNVSCRVPGGFLVTPSGVPYGTMRPEQVVFVDLDERESGYYGELMPSSEWRMHRDVYLNFPEAQAVVHTHSAFATALSTQRRGIPAFHYMVGVAGGKQIPCAEYATFGSQELSDGIVAAMGAGRVKACLLANHGVIAYSTSLPKALYVASEVETLAKQYQLACAFGPPVVLPDAEMDVILAKFKTYGKQTAQMESGWTAFEREHRIVQPPRRDLA